MPFAALFQPSKESDDSFLMGREEREANNDEREQTDPALEGNPFVQKLIRQCRGKLNNPFRLLARILRCKIMFFIHMNKNKHIHTRLCAYVYILLTCVHTENSFLETEFKNPHNSISVEANTTPREHEH